MNSGRRDSSGALLEAGYQSSPCTANDSQAKRTPGLQRPPLPAPSKYHPLSISSKSRIRSPKSSPGVIPSAHVCPRHSSQPKDPQIKAIFLPHISHTARKSPLLDYPARWIQLLLFSSPQATAPCLHCAVTQQATAIT